MDITEGTVGRTHSTSPPISTMVRVVVGIVLTFFRFVEVSICRLKLDVMDFLSNSFSSRIQTQFLYSQTAWM
jgi:hypothetical protein